MWQVINKSSGIVAYSNSERGQAHIGTSTVPFNRWMKPAGRWAIDMRSLWNECN